jgi:hypothetical protein
MGRPKGYDRETILVAARDLFWEQGYERTSIADLEERTGLNRSSLYTPSSGANADSSKTRCSATPTA